MGFLLFATGIIFIYECYLLALSHIFQDLQQQTFYGLEQEELWENKKITK